MSWCVFNIDGTDRAVRVGWSITAGVNGRETFACDVDSADGSLTFAAGDVVHVEERVNIVSSSVANPTIITTEEPHGVVTGMLVGIGGHTVTPSTLNNWHTATRINATQFSVPVNVTVGGGATGWVTRRIFGGEVLTPAEAGLGGYGVTPIVTHVEAVDYNAQAEQRVVINSLATGTLKAQLQQLVTDLDLTALHALQATGPTMAEVPCIGYPTLQAVLDKLSELTGYVWEFDPHDYLRMFLPASEACPFDVIDGDGHAIGDITTIPSRSEYRNRVILRFSNVAVASYGYLVTTANVTSGETVLLGSQVYTFRNVITEVAGYVLIGDTAVESLENLAAAITLGAGSGVKYAAATPINGSAMGYQFHSDALAARALVPGAAGNSIATTVTAAPGDVAHAYWGSATLVQGADAALNNVSIATDASWDTDPHDFLAESPETTDQVTADLLSAAILAAKLAEPRTVRYKTLELGARPGQTQTNTAADRHIDELVVLTDVVSHNDIGNRVIREVTAVTGLSVQAADRWQQFWKPSSGSVGGSAASVGGLTIVSGGGSSVPAPVVISLGGDRFHGVQL